MSGAILAICAAMFWACTEAKPIPRATIAPRTNKNSCRTDRYLMALQSCRWDLPKSRHAFVMRQHEAPCCGSLALNDGTIPASVVFAATVAAPQTGANQDDAANTPQRGGRAQVFIN